MVQPDDLTLWVGCQHGRLQLIDLQTGAIKSLQPPELETSTVMCMEKDNRGNIWFGLYNGHIAEWDASQKKFLAFVGPPSTATSSNMQVNSMLAEENIVWAATANGFAAYDKLRRTFTQHWLPEEETATSISAKVCEGIERMNDSTLLIGTLHGGMNIFNTNSKKFMHLSIADGLPSNSVIAIKKLSAHEVWFTTDFGIYRFNPADRSTPPVNMGPQHITSAFFATKLHTLQDGRWLTFNTSEAIAFQHDAITHPLAQTAPVITGLSVFGEPLPVDSLLRDGNQIELSFKENFFTIAFALLRYSRQQQVSYQYRLDGVDKGWVNSGTRRTAAYTDISPGTYRFEVKASDGTRESNVASFTIRIIPPFWATWWFISLAIAAIIACVFAWIKYREKQVRLMSEQKMQVQQLSADRLSHQLELEQITNFFSTSLIDKTTVDDVLWDVARNLIGRLGFVDCMIYLWNHDKTKMIQKAGFGPKGSIEEINKQIFDVVPGQGVVGHVMETRQPVMIADTSIDPRYRVDELSRLSEITVPIIYNNELMGIIDSEHHEKDFFKPHHLQVLTTISTLVANKIASIEAEQAVRQKQVELLGINEQLYHAKLEALRSQMNPHFIFNCINSIDALIQSNDKYLATVYLNKFARLLRNILDSSRQNTVLFSNDIATTKLYVELEQLRHENKFVAHFRIDDELMRDDYRVPPLVIQPFVENAILHGLNNKRDHNGILDIEVTRMDNRIRYVTTDNGIGRKASAAIHKTASSHLGMQMSLERVKLFNKEELPSVEVEDLYTDGVAGGTRVTVYLNLE